MQTLNKACGDEGIAEARLERAFDVWYPTLEEELNKLHGLEEGETENTGIEMEGRSSAIFEEILELSRDNQKLLRNPDPRVLMTLEEMKQQLDRMAYRTERATEDRRLSRKGSLMFVDELLHSVLPMCQPQYAFLIVLNIAQADFPWLYSMGKGLVELLQTDASSDKKYNAINDCRRLIDFSYDHRILRDIRASDKEHHMIQREQHLMIRDVLFDMLERIEGDLRSVEEQSLVGAAE